jgi:hypothetical protein
VDTVAVVAVLLLEGDMAAADMEELLAEDMIDTMITMMTTMMTIPHAVVEVVDVIEAEGMNADYMLVASLRRQESEI